MINQKQSVTMKILRTLIVVVASLFSIFPFWIMLKSSFEPYTSIVSLDFHLLPEAPSIANYIDVCTNYHLLRWFGNSLIVAFFAIALNMIVDVLAAYALSRLEFQGKRIADMMVLSSQIIPVQIIIVPLYLMMVKMKWLDSYKGLILPIAISPFIIFYLKQSFSQIPRVLDEAATLDGCSKIGVLWNVVIPNSKSAIGTGALLKFMWVWGDYMWPSLVTKKTVMRTLPVGIATFQRAGGTFPWELIMPAAVISSVPIILLFLFLQKYFIAGLTEGAVKG